MSSSTQPLQRKAFQSIHPNVPRSLNIKPLVNLNFQSQPYVPRKNFTYSISELLSFRANAVPTVLPLDAIVAFNEKASSPYKTPCKFERKVESDPKRLESRSKQVSYGKATDGYAKYTELVPISERRRCDPKTPDVHQSCSKRSWDGQIRKWRRALHAFDSAKDAQSLQDVRLKLVVINSTPNKIKTAQTEPINRPRLALQEGYVPKSLTFDDLA
ncbi:Histone RNA hairpin-binding protein RNA-binding domain-containing protein [Entamoeba marina]